MIIKEEYEFLEKRAILTEKGKDMFKLAFYSGSCSKKIMKKENKIIIFQKHLVNKNP